MNRKYPGLFAVVLAGGKGTRMNHHLPKVLIKLGGKPIIFHILQKFNDIGINNLCVVTSPTAISVKDTVLQKFKCLFAYQFLPLGTADALKAALPVISAAYVNSNIPDDGHKMVLVVNGDDSAFYSEKTLKDFIHSHIKSRAVVSAMTLINTEPDHWGRIIRDKKGHFLMTLEAKEYKESGLQSDEINCGAYLFNYSWLSNHIDKVQINPKGEYFIVDLLNMAQTEHLKVNLFRLENEDEWFSINNQKDLEIAQKFISENSK